MDTLEMLLKLEPQNLPEKKVKVKRLSEACGQDVVFALRALPYSRVAEIKGMSNTDDMPVQILLAGVTDPSLRDKGLMERYRAASPAELVKALLLPGEIEDLSREVEKLSGYRMDTLDEVKKK